MQRLGPKASIELSATAVALRRWSTEKQDYVVPSGAWTIRAGASSADIRQAATVEL